MPDLHTRAAAHPWQHWRGGRKARRLAPAWRPAGGVAFSRPGDVVTTGTCMAPRPIALGDLLRAGFDRFGQISAQPTA